MTRTASCTCGGLTAVCEGEPIRVSVCHCLACQKRTGSAFGVQARFDADKVTLTGPRTHYSRVGDDGPGATFDICPTCGTTLSWRMLGLPGQIAIAVGAFTDPTFPAPTRTVYESRAHPWLTLTGIEDRD